MHPPTARPERWTHHVPGQGHHPSRPPRPATDPAPHARRLPGSVHVAEPADEDRQDRDRSARPPRAGRRRDRREAAAGLLEQVGLGSRYIDRYPHSLSGGQRQRVAIARALSARPDLLVADEPISALDASVQAAMLNLLMELQAELQFACLFITHDLSAARLLADWIAVMYLGQVVEQGPSDGIFGSPRHPYTQALLSAVPVPDPVRQRLRAPIILSGDPPSPLDPPSGCQFHTRCPIAIERCGQDEPALIDPVGGRAPVPLPPRRSERGAAADPSRRNGPRARARAVRTHDGARVTRRRAGPPEPERSALDRARSSRSPIPGRGARRTTLADIAAVVGVSEATASRGAPWRTAHQRSDATHGGGGRRAAAVRTERGRAKPRRPAVAHAGTAARGFRRPLPRAGRDRIRGGRRVRGVHRDHRARIRSPNVRGASDPVPHRARDGRHRGRRRGPRRTGSPTARESATPCVRAPGVSRHPVAWLGPAGRHDPLR